MSEKERHFAPDVDKDFGRSTGMLMDTKELAPCEIVV